MIKKIASELTREKRIPTWASGVLVVGGVALVGFVIYSIYKKSKEKAEKKNAEQTLGAVDTEIRILQRSGQKLSFSQSAYITAANAIAQLLDGCDTEVSEKKVIEEVSRIVKNPLDWLNLVKAFGVRKIDNCLWGSGDTTYDLVTLLKEQLDMPIVYFSMDTNGFKKKFYGTRTLTILREYLASKGVQL